MFWHSDAYSSLNSNGSFQHPDMQYFTAAIMVSSFGNCKHHKLYKIPKSANSQMMSVWGFFIVFTRKQH